mgnify:CR=1 FL=1
MVQCMVMRERIGDGRSLVVLALGGVMVDAFGWRTAFFVAGVPGIAIVIAVLAFFTLRDTRSQICVVAALFFWVASHKLVKVDLS